HGPCPTGARSGTVPIFATRRPARVPRSVVSSLRRWPWDWRRIRARELWRQGRAARGEEPDRLRAHVGQREDAVALRRREAPQACDAAGGAVGSIRRQRDGAGERLRERVRDDHVADALLHQHPLRTHALPLQPPPAPLAGALAWIQPGLEVGPPPIPER